jgi:hypothetical protein
LILALRLSRRLKTECRVAGDDVVAGVQMLVERGDGGNRITYLDGIDDGFVFLENTQQVARVASRVELHQPHKPAQLAQHPRHEAQTGALRNRDVQLFIQVDERIRGTGLGRATLPP